MPVLCSRKTLLYIYRLYMFPPLLTAAAYAPPGCSTFAWRRQIDHLDRSEPVGREVSQRGVSDRPLRLLRQV